MVVYVCEILVAINPIKNKVKPNKRRYLLRYRPLKTPLVLFINIFKQV